MYIQGPSGSTETTGPLPGDIIHILYDENYFAVHIIRGSCMLQFTEQPSPFPRLLIQSTAQPSKGATLEEMRQSATLFLNGLAEASNLQPEPLTTGIAILSDIEEFYRLLSKKS